MRLVYKLSTRNIGIVNSNIRNKKITLQTTEQRGKQQVFNVVDVVKPHIQVQSKIEKVEVNKLSYQK